MDYYNEVQEIEVQLDDGAYVPERAHEYDAGLDLRSPFQCMVYPGKSVTIDTGVHVAIPDGYVGMLKSKSGLNVNKGILSEGVIDAGYTGSITVKLYNHGNTMHKVQQGDKITQLVILPIVTPEVKLVDRLSVSSERGDNGFGSTGR